jgi:hypothetical protein
MQGFFYHLFMCWRSSYQEGRAGIQLSRGEGWDTVIKRGGLGYSYQKGRAGIPLTGLTLPHVLSQDLDFQCHLLLCFFCVRWDQSWCEVFVSFCDIGRIGDHHCLNYLFIMFVISDYIKCTLHFIKNSYSDNTFLNTFFIFGTSPGCT